MAARFDRFIDRLVKARADHAIASLKTPKRRTAFEYGRVSGFYQGLEVAEQLVNDILAEEDKSKNERNS